LPDVRLNRRIEMETAERPFSHVDFIGPDGREPVRPWMTWLLTGSILAVYVAQLIGAQHGFDRVGTTLSVGPDSLARHRYWTLLTYAWAHAVPSRRLPIYAGFHLVTNIVPLFCVAPSLERRCGPWWLLALYCGGAIASALAWNAWHPRPDDAMIGASGALFALIAAGGALGVQVWRADFIFFQLPLRLDLRLAAIILCAFEAVQMLFRGLPDVAHVAHLGGALFGFCFAFISSRQGR
jgi:membrane associated rhomboid family serine protease